MMKVPFGLLFMMLVSFKLNFWLIQMMMIMVFFMFIFNYSFIFYLDQEIYEVSIQFLMF